MPGLSPYKSTLQIGQRVPLNARGTTVFLKRATGTLEVELLSSAISTGGSYTLNMDQADEWQHAQEFDQIFIKNVSGVVNTVELYIGSGSFNQPVPDIVNVQVTLDPTGPGGSSLDDKINIDIGQAGKQEMLPLDNDRVTAYITALSTNTEEIRVSDTDVDTDHGTPLAAGESLIWPGASECFACSIATNDQGAAVTVFKK